MKSNDCAADHDQLAAADQVLRVISPQSTYPPHPVGHESNMDSTVNEQAPERWPQQASYTREELLTSGAVGIFGPGNAKLPAPDMLMFDRITRIDDSGGSYEKGELIAELDIAPDLWFFNCHFNGDPVMPGCLGLDAMWQLVGFFLGWLNGIGHGRALGVGEVKFSGQVQKTAKKITYNINIKRIITRKLVLGIADGILNLDGVPIYSAKDMRVGLFQEQTSA